MVFLGEREQAGAPCVAGGSQPWGAARFGGSVLCVGEFWGGAEVLLW